MQINSGARLHVTNASAARLVSVINNDGTILVQNSTVAYDRPVTISGRYISDPSTNTFGSNVTVTVSGTLEGGAGDLFDFRKSLFIQSTNRLGFNLASSDVLFSGGGNHTNSITGSDFGTNAFYAAANFGYGRLAITNTADHIFFTSGDLSSSHGLYAQFVDLLGSSNNVANLHAPTGINVYYMLSEHDPRNAYLFDQTYTLNGGGLLLPAVPEPSVIATVLVTALVWRRKRRT